MTELGAELSEAEALADDWQNEPLDKKLCQAGNQFKAAPSGGQARQGWGVLKPIFGLLVLGVVAAALTILAAPSGQGLQLQGNQEVPETIEYSETGCSNADDILKDKSCHPASWCTSLGQCAAACQDKPGCVGFGYQESCQPAKWCKLWSGNCTHRENRCMAQHAGRPGLPATGRTGPTTLVVRGPSPYEFGWEVAVMVPHAYASVMSAGPIIATRSCGDLSALYWFSPMHENIACPRTNMAWHEWYGIQRDVLMSDVPDKDIPNWLPPPHKDHYSKFPALPGLFQTGVKYSIMVANKYTHEWGHAPVNYFGEKLLDWMITSIQNKCPDTQMVYERNIILDNIETYASEFQDFRSLHDFELLTARERVVMMPDVVKKSSNLSFNEVQMRAMAKHTCFATVQGGLMAFVAQFGGKHIVIHREGTETDAFYERLSRMGKGRIFVIRPDMGEHKGDTRHQFKDVFEREFLRDSCKACGILA